MPKAATQPNLAICKAEVLVLGAKLIDLVNNIVHATVVEVQAPVPLPLNVVVGEGSRPQNGQKTKRSPRIRTRHNCAIIVETPHCQNIAAIRIPAYISILYSIRYTDMLNTISYILYRIRYSICYDIVHDFVIYMIRYRILHEWVVCYIVYSIYDIVYDIYDISCISSQYMGRIGIPRLMKVASIYSTMEMGTLPGPTRDWAI